MQNSKGKTILILLLLFVYFLFSQFYLKATGSLFVYIINPIFFAAIAIFLKITSDQTYKSEKYKKSFIKYSIIAALLYAIIYLGSGLFLTFGKNPYSITVRGLLLNLYSTGLVIFFREYIRYNLMNNLYEKDKESIFVLIVIVFSMQDTPVAGLVQNFSLYYFFKSSFSLFIPSVAKNCLLTYMVEYADYVPSFIYEMALLLLQWVPPILPNAPWVFYAITDILFPVIVLLYCLYKVSSKNVQLLKKQGSPVEPKGLMTSSVLVVIIVWFALGIFPIKPLGIATASMEPTLMVGDAVIIKKCNANDIEVGDIVEYGRKDFTVIHRVISKEQVDGEFVYIMQGDNNSRPDADPVKEKQVQGKVIAKIPYLAWPTLWLERLSADQPNVDVETGK